MQADKPSDSGIGTYASIIELRAYVQSEFERMKADIENLFGVTTEIRKDDARRDERISNMLKTIDSVHERLENMQPLIENLKRLDNDGVYDMISEELSKFKTELEKDDLKRQLEESRGPITLASLNDAINRIQREIDLHKSNEASFEKESFKPLSNRLDTLEKSFAETRTKLLVIGAILAAVLAKATDLLIKVIWK